MFGLMGSNSPGSFKPNNAQMSPMKPNIKPSMGASPLKPMSQPRPMGGFNPSQIGNSVASNLLSTLMNRQGTSGIGNQMGGLNPQGPTSSGMPGGAINPLKGMIGDYVGGLKNAYQGGMNQSQMGRGSQLSGAANVGNKLMIDTLAPMAGTPSYGSLQDRGVGAFDPQSMLTRAAAPMFFVGGGSNPKGRMNTRGLNINKSLTPGTETTLDAIPHTLKGGGQISNQQASMFLREYANRPIIGQTVKNFLAGSPSEQEMLNFIKMNF